MKTRSDFEEFAHVLYRALMMILRYLERKYPDVKRPPTVD
jgi:hypothetical protein